MSLESGPRTFASHLMIVSCSSAGMRFGMASNKSSEPVQWVILVTMSRQLRSSKRLRRICP